MLKKILFLLCIIFSYNLLASDEDFFDFDLKMGIGISTMPLVNYTYESFLEYKFTKNTSLYLTASQTIVSDVLSDEKGEDKFIFNAGKLSMAGIELKMSVFIIGYKIVHQSEKLPNQRDKATQALILGVGIDEVTNWATGIRIHFLNDHTREDKDENAIVSFFIRRKFDL